MSVKDASVGHGRVKKGLRRKLTGSPRLLIGRSKTKDDTEHMGKIQACRHKEEVSMPSCQIDICEKLALKSTTSTPQRHSEERKVEEAASENQVIAAKSLPLDQSEVVADQPYHSQMRQKLSGLKQIFSPSFNCLKCCRKPLDRGGRDDEGEPQAVMFFNRQTRDSLDLTAHSAAAFDVSVSEVQVHGSSEHKCAVEEGRTIKAKTLRLYKRLILAPKHHSKAKTVGPDNSRKDDTPHAIWSWKKQSRPFWRHRVKKPSPFFQERIGGGTQEYIEEETIVLANKHADDPVPENASLSPYLDTEDKGRCPEMLAVSVDVSATSGEVKETTETTGVDTKASETPSHLKKDTKGIEEPKINFKDSLSEGEKNQMNQHSLEIHCGPLNNVASQCSEVDHSLTVQHGQRGVNEYVILNVSVASPEHPAAGEEIRSHVTYNSDSNTACQDASVGTDIASGSILGSIMANDIEIMEDLHVHPSSDAQSCSTEPSPFLKNGPDTLYRGMGHSEENGRHEFDQKEIFLLETACSVVEVAMRAALDQFRHELTDSVLSLDQ